MIKFVNLTPHDVTLTDIGITFEPEGLARVEEKFVESYHPLIKKSVLGEVTGLPPKQLGVVYIVSSMVMDAAPERDDLVVPITFGPGVVRENGQIKSVPGFKTK